MEHKERANGFLFGLMIGSIVGGTLGLLYAPTSGKRLRRKIADKTDEIVEEAESMYESGKEKVEGLINNGKKKVVSLFGNAK